MPGRSDPLASRLGGLTARELLTARAKAARAVGEHKRGQLAAVLVRQIDEELERRRAAKLGQTPARDAHERWQRALDAAAALDARHDEDHTGADDDMVPNDGDPEPR